jgi:hypothetical protein
MRYGTEKSVSLAQFSAVGVLSALFYWIATLTLWNVYTPWLMQYFKVDERQLGALNINFFTDVRLVIALLVLLRAPALQSSAKKL